jgi:hypothetical protein
MTIGWLCSVTDPFGVIIICYYVSLSILIKLLIYFILIWVFSSLIVDYWYIDFTFRV